MRKKDNLRQISLIFALLLVGQSFFAQSSAVKTITGVIRDQNNEALVGINIMIEGTSTGTVTGLDGSYSIAVSTPTAYLIFSAVGMETIREQVGNRTIIDSVMKDEATALDAVVVTALVFEANRDEIGYATSRIKGENIAVSGEVGLVDALAGKASGVRISRTSGDPGAASQILIRGQSTITRGLNP